MSFSSHGKPPRTYPVTYTTTQQRARAPRDPEIDLPDASPLIIEATIDGAASKEKNPYVPRTVDDIFESALTCLEAGASVAHNQNDEPNLGGSGRHASKPYVATWSRILQRHPDALLYPAYAEVHTRTRASDMLMHTSTSSGSPGY